MYGWTANRFVKCISDPISISNSWNTHTNTYFFWALSVHAFIHGGPNQSHALCFQSAEVPLYVVCQDIASHPIVVVVVLAGVWGAGTTGADAAQGSGWLTGRPPPWRTKVENAILFDCCPLSLGCRAVFAPLLLFHLLVTSRRMEKFTYLKWIYTFFLSCTLVCSRGSTVDFDALLAPAQRPWAGRVFRIVFPHVEEQSKCISG